MKPLSSRLAMKRHNRLSAEVRYGTRRHSGICWIGGRYGHNRLSAEVRYGTAEVDLIEHRPEVLVIIAFRLKSAMGLGLGVR